jgi:hypothetical protein
LLVVRYSLISNDDRNTTEENYEKENEE